VVEEVRRKLKKDLRQRDQQLGLWLKGFNKTEPSLISITIGYSQHRSTLGYNKLNIVEIK